MLCHQLPDHLGADWSRLALLGAGPLYNVALVLWWLAGPIHKFPRESSRRAHLRPGLRPVQTGPTALSWAEHITRADEIQGVERYGPVAIGGRG